MDSEQRKKRSRDLFILRVIEKIIMNEQVDKFITILRDEIVRRIEPKQRTVYQPFYSREYVPVRSSKSTGNTQK